MVKEKGKGYGGSATLSMASAAAHFVNRVMEAEAGKEDVVMCAFVASDLVPNTDFFASPLKFGVSPTNTHTFGGTPIPIDLCLVALESIDHGAHSLVTVGPPPCSLAVWRKSLTLL